MIVILLVALLAAAGAASALVLADSAVRGRNAFRRLHGQPARRDADCRVTVRFVDLSARPVLPPLRQRGVSPARPALRQARSPAPSLPAAA